MKTILLLIIRFYRRFISPLKPPSCRFYPTCSTYAMTAISEHGALRGGFLALKRILKCHPFHPGGYDPVPVRQAAGNETRDWDSTKRPLKDCQCSSWNGQYSQKHG